MPATTIFEQGVHIIFAPITSVLLLAILAALAIAIRRIRELADILALRHEQTAAVQDILKHHVDAMQHSAEIIRDLATVAKARLGRP